jgi:hypothetical protein
MKQHDAEDLFIRSLDTPLSDDENALLSKALDGMPGLKRDTILHLEIREKLRLKGPATFGPFFASKVMQAIQDSGIAIDRYLISFFRRFRLAAVGIAVGLIAVNVLLAEERDLSSVFNIGEDTTTEQETFVLDFFGSITSDL